MNTQIQKKILCFGLAFLVSLFMTGIVFAEEDAGQDSFSGQGLALVGEETFGEDEDSALLQTPVGSAIADAVEGASEESNLPGGITAETLETIEDEEVPLSPYEAYLYEEAEGTSEMEGNWALLNLLAALFTALVPLLLMIMVPVDALRRDEEAKRRVLLSPRILCVTVGILIPAIFFFTEDVSGGMVLADTYTPLMLVILFAQVLILTAEKARVRE